MTKNKRLLTIFVVIIGIAIFAMVFNKKQSAEIVTSVDPALRPVKQALFDLARDEDFQQLDQAEQLDQVNDVLEQIPDNHKRLKQRYQIALSTLPDIEFHGRVIDQNGEPVVNGSIYYSGENAHLSAGGGRGQAITDENGYFVIETSGAALVLGVITHPEIDSVLYSTGNLTARFRSIDGRDATLNYKNYHSKETAYIVNAWRLAEEYAGAVEGVAPRHYDADGKVYTLDFSKKRGRKLVENNPDAHLAVSCTRPHMEGIRDYGDWQVSITPVNGGIQETNDFYLNDAPASGYQPSLDIDMRKSNPDYQHRSKKNYYFTSNNGKTYGSLTMKITPFAKSKEEVCSLDIRFKINPTGSRNLETRKRQPAQSHRPSPSMQGEKLAQMQGSI